MARLRLTVRRMLVGSLGFSGTSILETALCCTWTANSNELSNVVSLSPCGFADNFSDHKELYPKALELFDPVGML